jgi:hypothetical protein
MFKFQPVTDESKVKNVLVLKLPTYCSPFMSAIYQNQVGTLNSIRESDEAEEYNMAVVRVVFFRWKYLLMVCVRIIVSENGSRVPPWILICLMISLFFTHHPSMSYVLSHY